MKEKNKKSNSLDKEDQKKQMHKLGKKRKNISKTNKIDKNLILNVKNLSKTYKTGNLITKALDNVNLQVKKGEFVAIVGPSGSGKTTLINCLGALDFPDSGQILYNINTKGEGKDITEMKNKEQKRMRLNEIGLIFQFYNLFPVITAFENVELPQLLAGVNSKKRKARTEKLLTSVGLKDRMEHLPTQLSGGEQQRVTIARSLVNDPLILLADEPTGELDTETTLQIIKIFLKLKSEGHSILMVTHNLRIAQAADRILTLTDGKITGETIAGKSIEEETQGKRKESELISMDNYDIDPTAMIQTINLEKRYNISKRYEIKALDGVNINIKKGEFVSVMGASGSGKTTLLNMIGALDNPTNGAVYINGINVANMDDNQRTNLRLEQIGFIFQFYNLVPVLTAYENVELPMVYAKKPKSVRKETVERALKLVGLSDKKDFLPSELSGGEKQRIAIARSICNEPAILIADEPTGELDTKMGMEIIQLLHNLNKELNQTILMVSHDPTVGALAERTLVMRDGRIIETIIN